ncbi:MAG: hypothetical protein Q9226_006143, partial [Calogaya cf. arnoldii]
MSEQVITAEIELDMVSEYFEIDYFVDEVIRISASIQALGQFYAFMALKNLKHIDIPLHQAEADDAVLEIEAYKVRKALMCDNFYEPAHNTGNKPILEKPSPRKPRPGVNALRVTIGNRRVPVTYIKPSLGPRAITFWTLHTPSPYEHGEEAAVTANKNKTNKGRGK